MKEGMDLCDSPDGCVCWKGWMCVMEGLHVCDGEDGRGPVCVMPGVDVWDRGDAVLEGMV